VGSAAANWLLEAGSLWAFVRAFGHLLGPIGLIVAHARVSVAAALPITFGGLGVVEGILVPVLAAYSTPRAIAILGGRRLPSGDGFATCARLQLHLRHRQADDEGRGPASECPRPPRTRPAQEPSPARRGGRSTANGSVTSSSWLRNR